MTSKPEIFVDVIKFLASKLEGHQYAIRGTASLVLHGLDFNVQDIDVIADHKTALYCNEVLEEILTEKVEYKESEKFKSYFGKFKINEILIEVYGDWQIKDSKGNWSEEFNASAREVHQILIDKKQVIVTTFDTELKMYLLMGRWNVYHKIKNYLRKSGNNNQEGLFKGGD